MQPWTIWSLFRYLLTYHLDTPAYSPQPISYSWPTQISHKPLCILRYCPSYTSPCTFTPSLNLTLPHILSHPSICTQLPWTTHCPFALLNILWLIGCLLHTLTLAHPPWPMRCLSGIFPNLCNISSAPTYRASHPIPPGSSHLPVCQPGTSNLLPASPLTLVLENWHRTLEMTAFDHDRAEAAMIFQISWE